MNHYYLMDKTFYSFRYHKILTYYFKYVNDKVYIYDKTDPNYLIGPYINWIELKSVLLSLVTKIKSSTDEIIAIFCTSQ